ncbi:MAG: T9SS type A sorting domain-containing protein [Bacteroidales bacterium]|nr:T9SS type A sorting domain-containing protein [Bacteroidales bacterium]
MKKILTSLIILSLLVFTSIEANAQYTYDSVSFESPTSTILIDTSNNNSWQIGTPSKLFFDAAHTGTKAILTDSINDYLPNDTSVFIYVIRNPYTVTCYTSMEFWHKYDTDTLTDKGMIDASYDGGSSWVTVSDTNDVSPMGSVFWWDYDFHQATGNYTPHHLITSGKSDGWILSRFNWQWWIPVKTDTIIYPLDSLMIRFTFISDAIETNKEGWMIDDILTYSAEWQLCSGIEEQSKEKNMMISPNPFSTHATLKADFLLNMATVTIYNFSGHIVHQTEGITGHTFTLSRDHLPPGLYYLVITEKNEMIVTEKIIITN